ncbi:hypothetical protein [Streptomyces sp. B21-083]
MSTACCSPSTTPSWTTETRKFLDRLPVSDTDREKIAHGNAERILKLGV